jgi:hypothetical protein
MKKFLLHTDGSKEQSLYCLYLAHVANTNLEDVEINVLQPKGVNQFEYLKLSPFEVNVFNYDAKVVTSMPKAHKFAYNLHDVFNIDYFIDFQKTATSAFLGTAFRAENRVGKASRIRNLLLSKEIEANDDWDYFEKVLAFLDWSFNFDDLKKEFESTGDDVLLFEVTLDADLKNSIEEKYNVHNLTQDYESESVENLLLNLEKVQYVFVNSKEDIPFFNYLNKIVIFNRDESAGDVLNYEEFQEKHLNEA